MEAAIHGVLSKLDQYSNYISPEDLGQFKTSVENQFGGIGIQVDLRGGHIVVISPSWAAPPIAPACRPVIRSWPSKGNRPTICAPFKMSSTSSRASLARRSRLPRAVPSTGKRRTFSLERELVHLETVMGDQRKSDDSWDFMLDHDRKIGYIRITSFSRDTEQDLTKALDELKRENVAA